MGMFEPFRTIGYVTCNVPCSVQRLGTETFVTVSVGKSWQIYNCAKLNLVLVGPQLPKKIRALASYRNYTFAAYGNDIGVFKRAHQVATWSRHNAKVNLLFLFGENILSVDVQGNLFIWAFKGIGEHLSLDGRILLGTESTPTCITHPLIFFNKVLIGNQDGSLNLWNISTHEKVYELKGWKSAVHCCVSSPNEVDVVAVGCADGKIHVHNVLFDVEEGTLCQATRGAVTALSFSTDGQHLLASGSSSGVICIWDYHKGRLQSVIRDAHDGSVISLHFFANEPVLMSTSADNSIKMWIFDTTDGDARLLRFRSGHSKPPLCIRFYANGRHILSAGQDRAFRLFSVVQDQQSRELSQRHVTKRAKKLKLKEEEIKLKPVIAFDVAEIRERDWSNVVTCHMDTPHAYVWRLHNFALGEHILKPTTNTQAPIKACTISSCGNFAILGTASGWIEKFNLQSGMSRGSYVDPLKKGYSAHGGEVVGVACDSTRLISAGYHGDIKVWCFKERELKWKLEVGCTVVKIVYHRSNGLLATVADDLVIRIFDVEALKLVRKFEGHTDRITDICFSEDGKWVMSSSMDGTLRIWDVILARQIDAMHVDVPITALSLSPNMDVLATTHVDQNGVHLWVKQAMFTGVTPINSQLQALPITDSTLLDQQIPVLVTLSLLPKSQCQSLINLDIIKARNKPIEPPKTPEKTPFFLPSIPSLSGEIAFKSSEPTVEEKATQSCRTTSITELSSPFIQLLHSSVEMKTYGSLNLWNISTHEKVYELKGWKSAVHCCVSSPNEVDVVAVGCADGKIHVHNVLFDVEEGTLCQATRGAVTALSFSTDGQHLLASGSSSGVICIWDYHKGRLQSVIRDAHDGSVISLHFFANEPVLMSTSADNSIKMWIFDTTDGDARLLRFRSGHSKPPLCIRFYANGRHILSAGQDRAFRLFSVVQDQQSRELSQRHVTKRAKKLKLKEEEIKLKPVIAFDVAEIRERDWSNVVTCHMDTPHAYVWRLHNFALGEHILKPTTNTQAPIKACTISSCGNFAILGTASGWIEKFNLQSGMSRGSYVDPLKKGYSAHGGEVVGVACDSTRLISAGYHGDIKVWCFKERELKWKLEVGCTVVKIVYHRSNGLLATVADDLVIRIFDVEALKLVRKFEGHTDRITDICFSEDGKWVMSSSMDGTLRIWDVILARQIDAMHVDVPITALSLSPNMDVLATTHVDQNGVHLWVKQAMFTGVTPINSQLQALPITDSTLLDQQIPVLVTLSLLPKSQCQSLINLDIIKARNKPIEPPKTPEKTPFFLPSIPSLSGEIAFKSSEPTVEEKATQSCRTTSITELSSPFIQLLHSSVEMKTFEAFTKYLKSLSPATLDVELRMLQIIDDDDDEQESENRQELIVLERLLDYFINEVLGRKNFDFIQALIRLFLKIHGETIRRQSRLQAKAQKLLEAQSPVWQKLDGLFQSTRCMVTFLSNSQF